MKITRASFVAAALAVAAGAVTVLGQSSNPFGRPTADKPQPAAGIEADVGTEDERRRDRRSDDLERL